MPTWPDCCYFRSLRCRESSWASAWRLASCSSEASTAKLSSLSPFLALQDSNCRVQIRQMWFRRKMTTVSLQHSIFRAICWTLDACITGYTLETRPAVVRIEKAAASGGDSSRPSRHFEWKHPSQLRDPKGCAEGDRCSIEVAAM